MHNDRIEAVARMQKYINEHIEEDITMQQLAKVANYSSWYAARIFHVATNKSPFAYIRELRLTKAALHLRDTRELILETALDMHFASHEGFTRAFSKSFGIAPSAYRKALPPIKLFYPYIVCDYSQYLEKRREPNMEQSHIVFTQVINKPERKLIVLRGEKATEYFEYCEEVGCDIWGELLSFVGTIMEPAGYWLPEVMQNGKSHYVQGVEVPKDYTGIIPKKYDVINLMEGYYMVFQGEPYPEDKDTFMTKIGELQKAIKEFNYEIYGYKHDDKMPRFQLAPLGKRGYIEAVPIKVNEKGVFSI